MTRIAMMVSRIVATWVGVVLLAHCGERRSDTEEEDFGGGKSARELEPFMSPKEYAVLARSAQQGDPASAYTLYREFTFGARDYGLAYFWCVRAKELGHVHVTEKEVRLAEMNVYNEASSYEGDYGEEIDIGHLLPE